MGLMMFNWPAILAATVAGMLLGALWYSPLLFGKAWMRALGKTEAEVGTGAGAVAGAAISCLLSAVGLAFMLSIIGIQVVQTATGGALVGGFLGLTLVATALLSDSLFNATGWRLYFIQAGYRLSYLIVMGAILGAMA